MSEQDPVSAVTKSYWQLLNLAVHEFRTPISVVSGYLRMLQRDTSTPLGDRHRKMVEEAEKSCARMVALIGELNEIAKLDDPMAGFVQETFDLFAMVREVAGEAREADDRGVQLKMRGAATGAAMKGDVIRLHAALSTLVRAVLREQTDGTVVMLDYRLTKAGKRRSVAIVIAKEADIAGISAATPSPFDEKRGGLGLALPIARRVIERHGGRVWSPPSEKNELGSKGAVLIPLPLTK